MHVQAFRFLDASSPLVYILYLIFIYLLLRRIKRMNEWNEMKWNEMRWDEMRWNEMKTDFEFQAHNKKAVVKIYISFYRHAYWITDSTTNKNLEKS
jgi:hypothetical protein